MAISARRPAVSTQPIDVPTIVSQLMTIEKRPLTALQTKEAGAQADITSYSRVQGAVGALQSAARRAEPTPRHSNPICPATLPATPGSDCGGDRCRDMFRQPTLRGRSADAASAQALASGASPPARPVVRAHRSVGLTPALHSRQTRPCRRSRSRSIPTKHAGWNAASDHKSNAGVTAAIVTDPTVRG